MIQSSGNGLLQLVDEILDWSKIESGKITIEHLPVNTREFVGELKGLFEPVAREKICNGKSSLLRSRIGSFYVKGGFDSFASLQERIMADPVDFQHFVEEITVNVIEMYRAFGWFVSVDLRVGSRR